MTSHRYSRRRFIAGGIGGLAVLGGLHGPDRSVIPSVPATIHGENHRRGHLIRQPNELSPPSDSTFSPIVIVGGGIAGLSAGWWLSKHGMNEYTLLELADSVGGTSRSGKSSISAFPWGAHYVPAPGKEATYVRMFFEEIGAITGYTRLGEPIFNEEMLCAAPQSRLYIHGNWQEGLLPHTGLSTLDQKDYDLFFRNIDTFSSSFGTDGRPAFTIPARLSSTDERFRRFDTMTFEALLRSWGISSAYLLWYINHCCRDDYGATIGQISAWAGLHYFCSRRMLGEHHDEDPILTWPEGNGFLVRQLRGRIGGKLRENALVTAVIPERDFIRIELIDAITSQRSAVTTHHVIYTAPYFTARHIIRGTPLNLKPLEYAPWAVANISLSPTLEPQYRRFAWDNVFYGGATIGYVVATHQDLTRDIGATVLTMYLPLSESTPTIARKTALQRSADDWKSLFLSELLRYQPELSPRIEGVDLWIWGHGMPLPSPGFLTRWDTPQTHDERIIFAHSDRTGFALFEEAQYWGVESAQAILNRQASL